MSKAADFFKRGKPAGSPVDDVKGLSGLFPAGPLPRQTARGPDGRSFNDGYQPTRGEAGPPPNVTDTIDGAQAAAKISPEAVLDRLCQSEERLYKELLAALSRRGLSSIHLPCEHCKSLSTVSIMRCPEVKMACRDAVGAWAKAFAEALTDE